MKKKSVVLMMIAAAIMLAGCSTEPETEQNRQENFVDEQKENKVTDKESVDKIQENTGEEESLKEKTAANGLFGVFETQTHYGIPVTEEIFTQADLTMVNIWGTFCGPCIREMPDLGELADEYAEKGVQIVGIISDVTTTYHADVETIIQKTGADYTHLILTESLYRGYLSEVQVVPTTVFVDSEGKQVGEVYTGSKDKETWAEIIDTALSLLE